ncbi:MAG: M48 family metalloprotease [Bryobacteraceae bacterium]|nr:M48 family metalloprotease [Bryobacteraceae bacterium]
MALSFPYQAWSQGGFNGPGRYQITNLKSGKVLDLDRNNQTSVIQFSSRGTDNQVWDIRAAGSGHYSLRNGMNGNALEATGTNNSTPVRATRYDGRAGQQWRFNTASNGSALIVSRLGKVLDIPDGTTRDGAVIQIYDSNGDSNQQFQFRPLAGNTAASAGNTTARNVNRVAASSSAPAVAAGTGRTALKPGWNMFSAEQDVELGQQAANEVSQQVLMLNDSRVDNYLNQLGQRLVVNAPGFKFPYTFKTVNDRGINAFALPGGHIYINRGVIEAADNESQLAGVMAHEAAHVALRHGTNQASKASAAQMPLAILGGLMGSNSTGAALAQLGAGFTVNSILLKYSRDAEKQADLMGTQVLFDSGLDPRAMGQFFQKIEGGNGVAFFSDHPNPDRRIESVSEEVARLGSKRVTGGTQEFAQIKRYVQSLPAPRPNQLQSQSQSQTQNQQQPNTSNQPDATSQRSVTFENAMLRINHPDNWQAYGQGDALTIAPRGGMVNDGKGNQALAYGVVVNIYEPHWEQNSRQQLQGGGYGQNTGSGMTPEAATNQLIVELQQSNRNMRVVRRQGTVNINGERGLSTFLSNDSPVQNGGRETNWLVTLPKQEGLLFFVFTAPEREFQSYESVFQQMLYSVRFKQQ